MSCVGDKQLPHTSSTCHDVLQRIVSCGSFDNFVCCASSSLCCLPAPLPCSLSWGPVAFCSEIISDPISCRDADSDCGSDVDGSMFRLAWLPQNACNLLGLTWVAARQPGSVASSPSPSSLSPLYCCSLPRAACDGVGVFCGMQRKWFSFLYNCCQRDLPQLQ